MPAPTGPAYRIETARARLRCFQPSDVVLLSRAIEESLEDLRPWMPWAAREPITFEERLAWLRTQRGNFDLGGDLVMGLFNKDETVLLGSLGLVRGDIGERELGYWIHVDHQEQGFATEASAAMIRVGFALEALEAVEIRCLPTNRRSARVAEKLGFSGPFSDPLGLATPEGGKRDVDCYTLSRVEYAQSPLRRADIAAYDILERRIF